jgi:hypothetical protein
MKNALFSLVAIGVASIAAIAATSTFLNTPHRIGPETPTTQTPPAQPAPAPAPDSKPATGDATGAGEKPATGTAPGASAPGAQTPGGATADTKPVEEEADKDPYEGIAPEELPPDLQYNADSSVSFPTNI